MSHKTLLHTVHVTLLIFLTIRFRCVSYQNSFIMLHIHSNPQTDQVSQLISIIKRSNKSADMLGPAH